MRDSAALFALSLSPQVDYKTPIAPSSPPVAPAVTPKTYEQIVKSDRKFADFVSQLVTNEGQSTGTPYATESRPSTHDTSAKVSEDMSVERLGRRARAAFGDYTPTTLTGASAGAYKHLFKPVNPLAVQNLPVYSWAQKTNEDALAANVAVDELLPSMMVERFSLAGDGTGYIIGESDWRGSGRIIEPSGVKFRDPNSNVITYDQFAALLPNHWLKNTAAKLGFYPNDNFGGTIYETLCDYRSFTMRLDNNPSLQKGYIGCAEFLTPNDPDSGAVRGNLEIGNQKVESEYTVLMSPVLAKTFNPRGKQKFQTPFSSEITVLGSPIPGTDQNHKMTLRFLRQTVTAQQIDSIDGDFAFRITNPPLALGLTVPVELELISTTPVFGA